MELRYSAFFENPVGDKFASAVGIVGFIATWIVCALWGGWLGVALGWVPGVAVAGLAFAATPALVWGAGMVSVAVGLVYLLNFAFA